MSNVADEVINELKSTIGSLVAEKAIVLAQAKEIIEAKDAEIESLKAQLEEKKK